MERERNIMNYESDLQIVQDAARMLIENHLGYSNSLIGAPSDNIAGVVGGELWESYVTREVGSPKGWDALDEGSRALHKEIIESLFEEACVTADARWRAAMTLLGL